MATLSQVLDHALDRLTLLENQLFMCPRQCPAQTQLQLERLRYVLERARRMAEKC